MLRFSRYAIVYRTATTKKVGTSGLAKIEIKELPLVYGDDIDYLDALREDEEFHSLYINNPSDELIIMRIH